MQMGLPPCEKILIEADEYEGSGQITISYIDINQNKS